MKKSVFNSTIYRKKIYKEDSLKKEILNLLSRAVQPVSTQDICNELSKPWHSIQTRCLRLQIENKVLGFRVGRINLWQIKRDLGEKK